MKAWQVKQLGTPETALSIEEIDKPEPEANQLLIKVSAAAVNNNDLNKLQGKAQFAAPQMPYTLGMEAAGIVVEAAEGLEQWIGRRVCAATLLSVGAYAEYALASPDMSFPVPDTLSDEEAAAFMVSFHTAYLMLFKRGGVQAGETLLIHGGSGGVGSAAIQLAKARGALVIATAGSVEKAAFCRALGADHVIEHQQQDFAVQVMEITADAGVQVVFDLVGGPVRDKSFTCMAAGGRYLAAGFVGDTDPGEDVALLRRICAMNISIVGGLMAWRSNPEPFLRQVGLNPFDNHTGDLIHQELCELLAAGKIAPQVRRSINFSALPEALTAMQQRDSIGKTVMKMT